MRHFTVVSAGADGQAISTCALGESAVFNIACRLRSQQANVFEGQVYRYSLNLDLVGACIEFRWLDPVPRHPTTIS
jgi:hypothetical protein